MKQKVVTFQFECYTLILLNDFHFHGSHEDNCEVHPKEEMVEGPQDDLIEISPIFIGEDISLFEFSLTYF
jgi:hypothetical protein